MDKSNWLFAIAFVLLFIMIGVFVRDTTNHIYPAHNESVGGEP